MGARNREEEEGYRTGPPGYIGWRNSFLEIDSGAPYTFKNTGSGQGLYLFLFLARKTPRNCHKFPPQPGSLIDNLETCQKKVYTEPEFVKLLRSQGIDSHPGGPVV
jgi:hypothetical protein